MISTKNNCRKCISDKPLSVELERLYRIYAKRRYVHPDPLELVLRYERIEDREIAALVASALAYGRVCGILRSAGEVLETFGGSPCKYIRKGSVSKFRRDFAGFKYRFHTGEDLSLLFEGVRLALKEFGLLEACFLAGVDPAEDMRGTQTAFVNRLCRMFPGGKSTLLPSPERGSACKRLNLMLRWLVRHDEVDPGGWTEVPASALIVPLDTHMHRIARKLGLTSRNAADWKTAEEVTKAFAGYVPEDPVRYDFVLTRFGIHPDFGRSPL